MEVSPVPGQLGDEEHLPGGTWELGMGDVINKNGSRSFCFFALWINNSEFLQKVSSETLNTIHTVQTLPLECMQKETEILKNHTKNRRAHTHTN